jgi:hypothetical protein
MSPALDVNPAPEAPQRPINAAPEAPQRRSPWVQAIDLAFVAIFALVALLALGWAGSGVREIGPSAQAVIIRFGAVVGGHGPGLLVTWPAPIERVETVPGPEQLVELRLSRFAAAPAGNVAPADGSLVFDPHRNAGFVLTGDTGLVQLATTLFYTVTAAPAYLTARDRLGPALDRLAAAAIAAVAAGRDLDGVLVARPEAQASAEAANQREQLRGAIVADLNRRLADLERWDGGLGVRVVRIDIAATLPDVLRPAYEGVLTAVQKSEQSIAAARTVAATVGQAAQRAAITLRRQAESAAAQRITDARTRTAELRALVAHADDLQRAPLLERVFRERIGGILEQAGSVTIVGAAMPLRLILPGAPQ